MKRFSLRNTLGWVAGAAALVVTFGLQAGIFNWVMGAVIGGAALVLVAYWVFHLAEQSRHARRLREFALTHGWAYRESGGTIAVGLKGFPFGEGTDREAQDLIEGLYSGVACTEFTYSFEHHVAGERTAPQIFTVTQARLPVPFPRLDLVPEDAGSRVLGAITGADIDLESAEFNRTWRVICADRKYAVDVVDPRMMQLLLAHRMPGVAVRIDGERVIAWSAGRAHTRDLQRRLNLVAGIANRLPAHVVRTYTDADKQRRAELDAREANAPHWAKTPGVLNSGRYTGIGVDADGDGVEDWEQQSR